MLGLKYNQHDELISILSQFLVYYLIFNMLDYKYSISKRCVITRRTTINNDS